MRRPKWVYGLAAGIAAVVVLAGAVLFLHTNGPLAQITVTGGSVHIEQGEVRGAPWLGPSWHNFSGQGAGYPLSLTGKGSFQVELPLVNADSVAHSVDAVTVAEPFTLASSNVVLPATIGAGQDSSLILTLDAPPSGGTYSFIVTIVCYA